MTASYTYDGDDLTRIRRGSGELVQAAELGTIGQGTLTYNDTAGTQEIIGQKDFEANEDDCATPLLFRGFVAERAYYRGAESQGLGREIDISLADLNSVLDFRMIAETSGAAVGKRPAETVNQRMAWIMGSAYLSGLVIDNGRVASSTRHIEAADYTNQFPRNVIDDCALAARGFNHHVQDYGDGPELIFRNDNTSTADSISLRISNLLSDDPWDIGDTVSGTQVFAPSKDARLTRSPALVVSKLAESYSKGTVVLERPATAAAFNGERGGNVSNSNIKTTSAASADASHQLVERSTEEDVLECSILVPSSAVNLFPAGYRIQAKFSHLTTEGYGAFTWFRIIEVGKKSLLKPAALYELRLKLSPQEGTAPAACPYDATPAGTFYPLGGPRNGPPPYDGYSNANPSDGVVQYARPGIYYAVTPLPGAQCLWHFPQWGVSGTSPGGPGTIDYAGDCVPNQLRFVLVGPGTLTVQTEIHASGVRPMQGSWGPSPGGFEHSIGVFSSGDAVEFVITADCVNIVIIGDGPGSPCGGKWGWSSAEWEPA